MAPYACSALVASQVCGIRRLASPPNFVNLRATSPEIRLAAERASAWARSWPAFEYCRFRSRNCL